ncbi:MAG TPA: hypothetical protein VHA80_07090 [Solirubrobacterales bacterium]|nr:hypothetical protein [Solirubrobacterales bacterium]
MGRGERERFTSIAHFPPAHARRVRAGEVAAGEAAAQPERVGRLAAELRQVEGVELDGGDLSGERLPGLGEQLDRRRSQHQESPDATTFAATAVDRPA